MLLIMRYMDVTTCRDARRFDGVRTPFTSRRWLSVSKHGYANQAIALANLQTEAPLTG